MVGLGMVQEAESYPSNLSNSVRSGRGWDGAGDDNEAQGFDRAATKVYEVDVGRHLGDLRRLLVQQVGLPLTAKGSFKAVQHWLSVK